MIPRALILATAMTCLTAGHSNTQATDYPYKVGECIGFLDPKTDPSPDMALVVNATDNASTLSSIAIRKMAEALSTHVVEQCALRKAGKPFITECPLGEEGFEIDGFYEEAFEEFGALKSNKMIAASIEYGKRSKPTSADVWEACRD